MKDLGRLINQQTEKPAKLPRIIMSIMCYLQHILRNSRDPQTSYYIAIEQHQIIIPTKGRERNHQKLIFDIIQRSCQIKFLNMQLTITRDDTIQSLGQPP